MESKVKVTSSLRTRLSLLPSSDVSILLLGVVIVLLFVVIPKLFTMILLLDVLPMLKLVQVLRTLVTWLDVKVPMKMV
jgi:hypothetical protein